MYIHTYINYKYYIYTHTTFGSVVLCILLTVGIVGLGGFVCGPRRVVVMSSHTVMVYTLGGQLVHVFGGYGSDPGRFSVPDGICIDDREACRS